MIVATVPAVTIRQSPAASGPGQPGSRYFRTARGRGSPTRTSTRGGRPPHRGPRPGPSDSSHRRPTTTRRSSTSVRTARTDGLDWHLFDLGGLLRQPRRGATSPTRTPGRPWWELRAAARAARARPRPDHAVLPLRTAGPGSTVACSPSTACTRRPSATGSSPRRSSDHGRRRGDLHGPGCRPEGPAVTGHGRASPAWSPPTPLISDPPTSVMSTLDLVGWLDQALDWVHRIVPFGRGPADQHPGGPAVPADQPSPAGQPSPRPAPTLRPCTWPSCRTSWSRTYGARPGAGPAGRESPGWPGRSGSWPRRCARAPIDEQRDEFAGRPGLGRHPAPTSPTSTWTAPGTLRRRLLECGGIRAAARESTG